MIKLQIIKSNKYMFMKVMQKISKNTEKELTHFKSFTQAVK